jgi:hypothetical protein
LSNCSAGGPVFTTAEIVSVHVIRRGVSTVSITLVEGRKDLVVTFSFEGIADLKLDGEDADVQNVINDLSIEPMPEGIKVTFFPCYGLWGVITAKRVRVAVD